MSEPIVGVLLASFAAVFFAAAFVTVRVGTQHMRPMAGTFISLVAGFLLTFSVALVMDARAVFAVSLASMLVFALMGAIQFPIGRFLAYSGIRLAGVPIASTILGTVPLFAAAWALLFLGEQITLPVAVGILAVVIGLGLVVTAPRSVENTPVSEANEPVAPNEHQDKQRIGWQRPILLGAVLALVGAAGYGTNHTLARYMVTSAAAPQVTATFALFFGTLYLFGLSARNLRQDLRVPRTALVMMITAGLFDATGVILMFTALSKAPVTLASPLVAVNPLIAIVFTHFFLQRIDRVTPRMVFGTILVVAGVIAVIFGRTG